MSNKLRCHLKACEPWLSAKSYLVSEQHTGS